jgi:hypothetical protein
MASLREQVGHERQRLVLVRKALSASLAETTDHGQAYVPFYIAVGKYIESAMGRLHAQDERMSELIPERAPKMDDAVRSMLKDVHDRLDGSKKHLNALKEARQALESKGAAAVRTFEAAGKAYTDYIATRMGHQARPSDMAAQLFSEADWTYMAGASEADIARENTLFESVRAALPPSLKSAIP